MTAAELTRAVNTTLMPGFAGPSLPAWLATELAAGLGSVCLFGTNVVDASQVRTLVAAIHEAGPGSLVAIDEEGGDVTRLHYRTGSPHPSAAYLGRLDDESLTEAVARAIGDELRDAGVDLNLAPVADVNSNPRNPVIGVRSFGADAVSVGRHVAAYTRGLQGAGVAAAAKHFPGHGDTATDSHRALPVATPPLDVLTGRELVPFRAAVAAGTLAVMTSHILVPALDPELPATLSSKVLDVLRTDLGFTGAIVSDALDMAGASAGRGIPEAAVLALAAGVDLLCIGTENSAAQLAQIRDHLLAAVRDGRLSEQRVFDAAARVRALSAAVTALRRSTLIRGSSPVETTSTTPPVTASGFWLRRPLPPLRAPVLMRLASPVNIAAGDTAWGIAEHVADIVEARLPGATCLTAGSLSEVDDIVSAGSDRPLVVQARDFARVPFLTAAATLVRQRRPDAILVDLGWPELPGVPAIDIATFGSSRGLATPLIELLAQGHR